MIRVLHVIGAMDRGGAETMIMNLYRAIDRTKVQFDFWFTNKARKRLRRRDQGREARCFRGLPRFKVVNYSTYRDACRDFFSRHPEHPVVMGISEAVPPVKPQWEAKRQAG